MQSSMGGFAALVRDAALLVGNDSGPAHLAAALGTPSVVVFLSGDPVRWRTEDGSAPYAPRSAATRVRT
jgi:ADP-heptose:LPS heptosyltransferase